MIWRGFSGKAPTAQQAFCTMTERNNSSSAMIEKISAQRRLIDKYQQNRECLYREGAKPFLVIVQHQKMIRLLNLLKRIAPTDAAVLLMDETFKQIQKRDLSPAMPRCSSKATAGRAMSESSRRTSRGWS
jgi:hypothetical protein